MTRIQKPRLALIGTDTYRGKELLTLLSGKKNPLGEVDFFDPGIEKEYSKLIEFRGEPQVVKSVEDPSLGDSDLIILASERAINREYGRWALKHRIPALDLGQSFEDDTKIPVLVAGINTGRELRKAPGLLANPHPATIILSHESHLLEKRFGLKRALACILQPVSAYEDGGIQELAAQSFEMLNCSRLNRKVFKGQIAFNLLSQVDEVDEDGFSGTESRIVWETRFVLGLPRLPLSISLVQAPVFHSYSIMTHVVLKQEAGIPDLEEMFQKSKVFKYAPPSLSSPVSSVAVSGKSKIYIGQIKRDPAIKGGFWLWAAADNLTSGSALNGFEIAREMLKV